MKHWLLLLACACASSGGSAQGPASSVGKTSPAQASEWASSKEEIVLVAARIALPTRPGGLAVTGTKDFSHPGESVDSAVTYASADEQVFATAYLYYPGLAHTGLAAIATDSAIRSNSPLPVRSEGMTIVAGAGSERAAVRLAYSNYRGNLATRAAFLKAGRYLVKLRVSGPEARRAEVESAMAGLLAGLRVGTGRPIYPAAAVDVKPCDPSDGLRAAGHVPSPGSGDVAALGFLGTFDGAGLDGKDEKGKTILLPSRVPEAFCSTSLSTGHLLLRASAGEAKSIDGRTRLVVLLSDSGRALELVETHQLRFAMLYHDVGETSILTAWDGVPSNAQIEALLTGKDKVGTRILARVALRPDKGAELSLPEADDDGQKAQSPPVS